MDTILHTLNAVLAGVWLGGVIFTTAVVSPALEAMGWEEARCVKVRSVIGGYYTRLGGANLALLALFAALDGWASGFGGMFYAEYVLIVVLFGLVAAHGAFCGRRLTELAEAEQKSKKPEGQSFLLPVGGSCRVPRRKSLI